MEHYFLDTNVIIRYLTRDNPQQAEQARTLFRRVEDGELTLTTCEGVVVEVVQVLSSRVLYNLPRAEIGTHLSNILSLTGLKLSNKRAYLRALDLYTAHNFLDFVDALNVAHMERQKLPTIATFDQDFDRITGIERAQFSVPQAPVRERDS